MYNGDPTFTFGMDCWVYGVVANPKSAIFGIPFFSNMLAGFKSLCTIPKRKFLNK